MIDIYRGGAVVASVHASDSDKVTKKVMGENTLSLSFTLAAPFDFKIGDYLYFAAEKYTLNITPELVKRSTTMFDYTLLFEGIEYEFRKVRLLFATEAMGIGGGADFSLMGNAALFAQVIVANLNRVQTGWTVGSVIESETKNLTFAGDSCLTAINKVVTEFDTEFWIGQDKTVNIGKKGSILPVVFEYGLGNGLYSITRTNVSSKDIITRLYPFGSEQNLPKGYRGNAKRLQIAGDYIEANVSKYDLIESSENFDVKPERTGTITALGADIFTFIDSSMDFDLNAKVDGNTLYLVPGTTAKIHFQSGDLAGYEFELSSYDHATKAFKLVEFKDEIAYNLPNDSIKPAVGDKYIILDIYMPQTYVDAAEARLLAKAQESLAQNSEPQVSYKVAVDPKFVAEAGLTFASGDYVGIKDTQLLIDRNIRQVAVTRYINYPDKYEFDLADTVEPSLTTQILTTLEATDIIIKQNKLADPARARRNWKTVEELRGAIYDVDGYFDTENIKPFSIETNMLTVGSKGNQFSLDCYFQANYGGVANNVVVGNGSLAHFTIEESIRTWTITGLTDTMPDNNLRYIYVACLKSGNTGQVTISATTKAIEDSTYYYFLAGVISSVIDSARQISLLFGFTSINGRFIKTGRVQSADGNTYFDLDSGEIQGKITFKAGSSGYSQLTDKPDLSVYPLKTYVDSQTANLQSQIDGNVTAWFNDYLPTLANIPASGWGSDAVRDIHLGDLFYWTSKGYAYRFQKVSGVYSWERLSDTDLTLALANAAKAQDTADGKRRVFITQPTPPYDLGDLWSQGTAGDLMKCKVAKAVGTSYAAGDWEKASKYTDDTAAIAAQTAANNAATAATAAQTSATAANNLLADIANDDKLTASEKQSTKLEWDIIVSEKVKVDAQADVYSVSKTAYATAYNALSTYITPLLTDLTATTAIVGTTFRANFKTYYDARQDILNAISTAAKTLANAAQTTANSAATAAAAAQTSANNAATAATAAQTSATAANNLLADIANDDKLTPSEKQSTKLEWDVIVSEKVKIDAQADVYSVSKTAYATAYNALSTYITPLLSDLATTSVIVGTTFRNTFKTYYDARQDILNAISTAAKTLANSAQSTADNAATAATAAQTSATAANNLLADIANDDKLTPSEKQSTKKEWDVIVSEKVKIDAQADVYSVSKTAYATAYNALSTYITPLLTDITTTTAIVGATFRTTFKTYYDARQDILNAISTAAKTLANTAQSTADTATLLAKAMNSGKVLYTDPNFKTGYNGITVYNNSGGTAVTVVREAASADSPNGASGFDLNITYVGGSLGVSPGLGGFQFATQTRAGAILVVRIIANIPVGYSIAAGSNSIGTGGVRQFITPTAGTGTFTEYVYLIRCGNTGTFSTTGFFYITGTVTPGISWRLAFATVYDTTATDIYTIAASAAAISDMASDGKFTPSEKLDIKRLWLSIQASYSNTCITSDEIGWAHDDLDDAFVLLAAYINPLLASMTTTSDIVRATFDSNINNYLREEAEVRDAVTLAVNSKAKAADYVTEALKNDTDINGGLVSTTMVKVGAVNQSGTWVAKAFINGAGSGANTPRFGGGGDVADAIARIGGDKSKPMAVITEGAKAIFDSGEIGGWDIGIQGIEKTEAVTNDGDTFSGTVALDWKEQAITFLRDGATKLKLSAKKLLTGIPSTFTQTVAIGTWKNAVVPPATTPLATLYNLSPASYTLSLGYTCQEFQDDYTVGDAYLTGFINTISIAVTFMVKVNVWKTDASGNKVGSTPIASKSKVTMVYATNSGTSSAADSMKVDFNLSAASYVSFEVVVSAVQNNSLHWESLDSSTYGTETFNSLLSHTNTSATYVGNTEFFEVGYTGFRVVSELAYLIFNTLEATNQLLLRGNAYLRSKYLNTTVYLDDASFRANRLDLQGMLANLLIKSSNYAMVAGDESYAGVAVIGASATVTITLPDLNASKVVNGQTIYYNDRRVLFIVATTKQITLLPYSGQTFANATSGTIDYNKGYIYIGNRSTLNWLCIGVG